jgi:hypothetical protein
MMDGSWSWAQVSKDSFFSKSIGLSKNRVNGNGPIESGS